MIRLLLLSTLVSLTAPISAQLSWVAHDKLHLEGKAFTATDLPFDRLPARAQKTVRKRVWELSRDSSGMLLSFVSDAPELHVRWDLRSARLAMPHMPASGVSGLDLYVRHGKDWRWLRCAWPSKQKGNQVRLFAGLPKLRREFRLYLPLYNAPTRLELGVPEGSALEAGQPRPKTSKPLVFYGTSITHGACASRPGMSHVAILGRTLDREVLNFGFSGNGTMDAEVGSLLAELDPAVFVIDCLPNMRAAQIEQRCAPLVYRLRQKHAETPILLVEDRSYADSFLIPGRAARNETSRRALRDVFTTLQMQRPPVANLHYLRGDRLLGADREDTVDGSHPTDLGFFRQAKAFASALRPLLGDR